MGRPPLAVGSSGDVSVLLIGPKLHRARTRYRDADGVVRLVERTGRSEGAAKTALKAALANRADRAGGSVDLTAESTVKQLLDTWWTWKLANSTLSAGTLGNYRDIMSRIIIPGIGALRLREATTGRMDRWLISERSERRAQAELARTILTQAVALAARYDAVTANPMSAVSKPRKIKKEVRALTNAELSALRKTLAEMRQSTYLADAFETQLGLGARIGEIFALTVGDLDLDQEPPRVTIAATVITPTGGQLSRQPHTKKGPRGRRVVVVPDWVSSILRARAKLAGPSGLLFATRKDTLVSPHNAHESWRNVRNRRGLGWVTPHHLRKTATTAVNDVFGLEVAAEFLDHSSTLITATHYVEAREKVPVDARAALDSLAPADVNDE